MTKLVCMLRWAQPALYFAIDLGAQKENDKRDPDPGKESHCGAETAVGAIVGSESLHVPTEEKSAQNP
jgi:hypothetical protein